VNDTCYKGRESRWSMPPRHASASDAPANSAAAQHPSSLLHHTAPCPRALRTIADDASFLVAAPVASCVTHTHDATCMASVKQSVDSGLTDKRRRGGLRWPVHLLAQHRGFERANHGHELQLPVAAGDWLPYLGGALWGPGKS
jgi:hypothetical protein